MKLLKISLLALAPFVAAGCVSTDENGNRLVAIGSDRGSDSGSLSQLESAIYIDPDGCHIWMIDDGVEGYWSRRLDPRSGLPVCTEPAPRGSIVGDYSSGSAGLPDFTPGF